MNDNSNRVKWLLGIGATLIYMAGISFFSSSIGNDALKILVNTLISIALIAVSIGVEDGFKYEGLGKYSFALGFISFLSTFIYVGEQGMFGAYFSLNGDGYYLYLTFLFILASIFSYVCSLRYKDYLFIHLLYSGLLVSLYTFMCHFSSNVLANCAVCGIIVLFLNTIHITDNLSKFGKYTSLIYALFSAALITSSVDTESYLLFIWIIIITNALNIFLTICKDKGVAIREIAIFQYVMNACMVTTIVQQGSHYGLNILLTAVIIALFELFLNYFKIIEDKKIKLFLKVVVNLAYIILFSSTGALLEFCILTSIVFGTSFVNSYVYRNDEYEYNIIPLKLMLVVSAFMMVIDEKFIQINDVICLAALDIASIAVMFFTKNNNHKIECYILTLILSYLMLNFTLITPSLYVIAAVLSMLNYYIVIIRDNEQNTARGRIYYGALLLTILMSLDNIMFTNKYLIASLIFGILTFLSYKDRTGFAISLPALFISLNNYIGDLSLTESTISLLKNLNNFVCITLWINNLNIDKEKKINAQAVSLFILSLIAMHSETVLDTLLTVIVSVLMIYSGIKNKEYNRLHNFGIVIVILSLLNLTSSLGEARAFIYLLIVGGGIIYFVIRLAAKNLNNSEVKEEDNIEEQNDKKESDNEEYCIRCGNKLKGTEKFCGKCGNKLK